MNKVTSDDGRRLDNADELDRLTTKRKAEIVKFIKDLRAKLPAGRLMLNGKLKLKNPEARTVELRDGSIVSADLVAETLLKFELLATQADLAPNCYQTFMSATQALFSKDPKLSEFDQVNLEVYGFGTVQSRSGKPLNTRDLIKKRARGAFLEGFGTYRSPRPPLPAIHYRSNSSKFVFDTDVKKILLSAVVSKDDTIFLRSPEK